MIPLVLLWLLCVTDAAFAGFRAAAGRDPRIFKSELYRRAIRRGIGYGLVVSVVAGIGALGVCNPALSSTSSADLAVTASAMLLVLAPYASLTLVALGIWATTEADARTLASVIVLGPLTLVRPLVIVAAGAVGACNAPTPAAGLLVAAVCVLQLLVGPALEAGARAATGSP